MTHIVHAALIILYNPTDDEIKRIIGRADLFDMVYVYDNSPKPNEYAFDASKIIYYGTGNNDGLAHAYNYIIEIARNAGVNWITLFDQDSEITKEMVDAIRNYINGHDTKEIAAVVPAIQYGEQRPQDMAERVVMWAINSGETINIECIYKSNIKFDENLFLDRVDRDFSKQVEIKNLKMIQVPNAVLKHQLGEKYNGHTVHSPLRNYYIFKNRLYYNDKYYGVMKAKCLSLVQSLRHITEIILSKKDVKENLQMIRQAKKDYKLKRLGKKNYEV